MAAPTNSGESDMATEDFFLNLSPLPSPRWSPLRLTPSPPRHFLPSSSSMVMQYQRCNQSMDNPPQNQEHDNIVDPPPYLAGDSALLQQQLRKNNQGFEESNMGFEEESEEEMMSCFYLPPSPTYFPLYRPMPSVFFVSSEQENISLAFSYQHILEDKSGELHAINSKEGKDILGLLMYRHFFSYMVNKFGDLDQIARAASVLPENMQPVVVNIINRDTHAEEVKLRRINWLEQKDEDNVGQPVFEVVGVVQQLIQNRGGWLDVIFGGGVFTLNGLERSDGTQGSPTAPETLLKCQAKLSFRVWLRHDGQWVAEARYMCSHLNIGSFTTVEDAVSAYEVVMRWSGWTDLSGFHGLFENENRSKLSLLLPPPTQELNPVEDLDWCVGTGSERTGERVMADQAQLNSGCLEKRKAKEKNPPGGKKRKKKTNGVRIAIPLEDISQTKGMRLKEAANHLEVTIAELMSSCREYAIQIWSPRNEHKLIMQPLPDESPAVVNQEVIPQLTSHNVPSDQALMATVDTNSVVEKEIPLTQFLPTAQQKNLDAGFGNDEAEAIEMGGEEIEEGVIEEAQLNSGCSKKQGKRKVNTPGGERVSISTLEHVCQGYDIPRWASRGKNMLISQSCPNKSPAVADQEGTPKLNSIILASDQALAATVDTNRVVLKEIPPSLFLPTAQQANLDEHFGNHEVEAIRMGSEGIGEGEMEDGQMDSRYLGKGKRNGKSPGGERGNKKDAGVRKLISQSCPNETPEIINQEGFSQLNFDTLPSDQALQVTVDKNSIVRKEIPPLQFSPTAPQEYPDEDFGNDGGRTGIPLEVILQTKGMNLKDAAKHLKVSQPELKATCWDYGIHRWPPRKKNELIHQSYQNETPVIVGQEGISQLNSDTLPSDQPLAVTVDTNSGIVMEIHPPQFSPKACQENPNDNFGNYEVEAVGMGVEGTKEGEMEEGKLNSGCLGKGKSKVGTPRGDRGSKKTNRVKIPIPLEDILQARGLHLNDAAKKFKVSRSTLKRVCRGYGILSWLPSNGNEHISQSCPKESPAVVDQEGVQQLNCDILPSNQALAANVDTNSVVLKARWVDDIIVKIRLPKPWKMAELEQQVKKRLKLESGTYYIRYKDEENELITILCDEDLQEYISSSKPLNTSSIEVFLVPK